MPVQIEGKYAGDFLKWEDNQNYSREDIVILAGSGSARVLLAGMVLGRATKGAAVGAAVAGNTGNGTISAAPTVGAATRPGVYRAICTEPATNVGVFVLEDPIGILLGTVVVGVASTLAGLGFTIADGATDFVSGDSFTITVAAGNMKAVQLTLAATNGALDAFGILYGDVTAADGTDALGIAVVRQAIIETSGLIWPAGISDPQKATALAQLAASGAIVARVGV